MFAWKMPSQQLRVGYSGRAVSESHRSSLFPVIQALEHRHHVTLPVVFLRRIRLSIQFGRLDFDA
ncbi:hypothetical protein RESH_00137 [Rhodopirellula europaea SH398]|uniref:Uncharacterized protein n=2 Tax=Rhodopirellula europaea TaxID=1263866 RepID=M5SCC4_9BACT|nr:hypothetical protein RE6C_01669 [Rhodopirellula europaea 6C]EMI29288.1 hypothetical protein RESH_00137 [Rhodopirellula europaea SH398]